MEHIAQKATSNGRRYLRPPVVISAADYERLAGLGAAALEHSPEVGEALLGELDRARVVDGEQLPANVVGMNSEVTYRDEATGQVRTVRLVYPIEADIGEGRISVVTPIGAALIGVAEGQSIGWRTRSGDRRVLVILRVSPPQP
ncbi:MAG: nucleoside diphosphate kinase regulator [Pseudorhodoplanes sp.]